MREGPHPRSGETQYKALNCCEQNMIMFLSPSAPPPSTLAPQHLVSSLHTFLQYLCAHVKLGTSQSSQETTALGGNWGGTESIGVCNTFAECSSSNHHAGVVLDQKYFTDNCLRSFSLVPLFPLLICPFYSVQ